MKKMLCALVALMLMVCSFAMAETVAPQFTELDTANGAYPVSFFEAEGKTITVETIERDEFGHINLNGGMDAEGGYTLTSEDDTNGWTTLIWDDFCTYTERAKMDLTLAENVTLNDSWDIDGEAVTATGVEAVTQAIMESANDSFYEHNTELVIEDGKVTEINRHYVP